MKPTAQHFDNEYNTSPTNHSGVFAQELEENSPQHLGELPGQVCVPDLKKEHFGHDFNMNGAGNIGDQNSAFAGMYETDANYRWRKVRGNLDLFVMERNERHLTSLQWKWQKMSKSHRRRTPVYEELDSYFYDRWKTADNRQQNSRRDSRVTGEQIENHFQNSPRRDMPARVPEYPSNNANQPQSNQYRNEISDSSKWSRHGYNPDTNYPPPNNGYPMDYQPPHVRQPPYYGAQAPTFDPRDPYPDQYRRAEYLGSNLRRPPYEQRDQPNKANNAYDRETPHRFPPPSYPSYDPGYPNYGYTPDYGSPTHYHHHHPVYAHQHQPDFRYTPSVDGKMGTPYADPWMKKEPPDRAQHYGTKPNETAADFYQNSQPGLGRKRASPENVKTEEAEEIYRGIKTPRSNVTWQTRLQSRGYQCDKNLGVNDEARGFDRSKLDDGRSMPLSRRRMRFAADVSTVNEEEDDNVFFSPVTSPKVKYQDTGSLSALTPQNEYAKLSSETQTYGGKGYSDGKGSRPMPFQEASYKGESSFRNATDIKTKEASPVLEVNKHSPQDSIPSSLLYNSRRPLNNSGSSEINDSYVKPAPRVQRLPPLQAEHLGSVFKGSYSTTPNLDSPQAANSFLNDDRDRLEVRSKGSGKRVAFASEISKETHSSAKREKLDSTSRSATPSSSFASKNISFEKFETSDPETAVGMLNDKENSSVCSAKTSGVLFLDVKALPAPKKVCKEAQKSFAQENQEIKQPESLVEVKEKDETRKRSFILLSSSSDSNKSHCGIETPEHERDESIHVGDIDINSDTTCHHLSVSSSVSLRNDNVRIVGLAAEYARDAAEDCQKNVNNEVNSPIQAAHGKKEISNKSPTQNPPDKEESYDTLHSKCHLPEEIELGKANSPKPTPQDQEETSHESLRGEREVSKHFSANKTDKSEEYQSCDVKNHEEISHSEARYSKKSSNANSLECEKSSPETKKKIHKDSASVSTCKNEAGSSVANDISTSPKTIVPQAIVSQPKSKSSFWQLAKSIQRKVGTKLHLRHERASRSSTMENPSQSNTSLKSAMVIKDSNDALLDKEAQVKMPSEVAGAKTDIKVDEDSKTDSFNLGPKSIDNENILLENVVSDHPPKCVRESDLEKRSNSFVSKQSICLKDNIRGDQSQEDSSDEFGSLVMSVKADVDGRNTSSSSSADVNVIKPVEDGKKTSSPILDETDDLTLNKETVSDNDSRSLIIDSLSAQSAARENGNIRQSEEENSTHQAHHETKTRKGVILNEEEIEGVDKVSSNSDRGQFSSLAHIDTSESEKDVAETNDSKHYYHEEMTQLEEERQRNEEIKKKLLKEQHEMEYEMHEMRKRLKEKMLQQEDSSSCADEKVNEKIDAIERQIAELNNKLSDTSAKMEENEKAKEELRSKATNRQGDGLPHNVPGHPLFILSDPESGTAAAVTHGAYNTDSQSSTAPETSAGTPFYGQTYPVHSPVLDQTIKQQEQMKADLELQMASMKAELEKQLQEQKDKADKAEVDSENVINTRVTNLEHQIEEMKKKINSAEIVIKKTELRRKEKMEGRVKGGRSPSGDRGKHNDLHLVHPAEMKKYIRQLSLSPKVSPAQSRRKDGHKKESKEHLGVEKTASHLTQKGEKSEGVCDDSQSDDDVIILDDESLEATNSMPLMDDKTTGAEDRSLDGSERAKAMDEPTKLEGMNSKKFEHNLQDNDFTVTLSIQQCDDAEEKVSLNHTDGCKKDNLIYGKEVSIKSTSIPEDTGATGGADTTRSISSTSTEERSDPLTFPFVDNEELPSDTAERKISSEIPENHDDRTGAYKMFPSKGTKRTPNNEPFSKIVDTQNILSSNEGAGKQLDEKSTSSSDDVDLVESSQVNEKMKRDISSTLNTQINRTDEVSSSNRKTEEFEETQVSPNSESKISTSPKIKSSSNSSANSNLAMLSSNFSIIPKVVQFQKDKVQKKEREFPKRPVSSNTDKVISLQDKDRSKQYTSTITKPSSKIGLPSNPSTSRASSRNAFSTGINLSSEVTGRRNLRRASIVENRDHMSILEKYNIRGDEKQASSDISSNRAIEPKMDKAFAAGPAPLPSVKQDAASVEKEKADLAEKKSAIKEKKSFFGGRISSFFNKEKKQEKKTTDYAETKLDNNTDSCNAKQTLLVQAKSETDEGEQDKKAVVKFPLKFLSKTEKKKQKGVVESIKEKESTNISKMQRIKGKSFAPTWIFKRFRKDNQSESMELEEVSSGKEKSGEDIFVVDSDKKAPAIKLKKEATKSSSSNKSTSSDVTSDVSSLEGSKGSNLKSKTQSSHFGDRETTIETIGSGFSAVHSDDGSHSQLPKVTSSYAAEPGWEKSKRRQSLLYGLGTNWCVCPQKLWKHLEDETDDEPITRRKCISLIMGSILAFLLLAVVVGLIIGIAANGEEATESPIRFVVIQEGDDDGGE